MLSLIKKYFNALSILLIMLNLFLFVLLNTSIVKNISQIKMLKNINYNYVYYLNNETKEKNEYIYVGNKLVFHTKIHSEYDECDCSINSETIMYKNNENCDNYLSLKANEIAVSKNISEKYDLKIGDTIYCYTWYSSNIKEYIIKHIFGNSYGFSEIDISNDKGIILLGYDDKYLNISNEQYLLYSNKTSTEINNINTNSIIKIDKLSDDRFRITLEMMIYTFISMLIIFLLNHIYFVMNENKKSLMKRYLYGEKKINIIKTIIKERFFVIFLITLMVIVLNIFLLNQYDVEKIIVLSMNSIMLLLIGSIDSISMIKGVV